MKNKERRWLVGGNPTPQVGRGAVHFTLQDVKWLADKIRARNPPTGLGFSPIIGINHLFLLLFFK
jgi:hypothetical protein